MILKRPLIIFCLSLITVAFFALGILTIIFNVKTIKKEKKLNDINKYNTEVPDNIRNSVSTMKQISIASISTSSITLIINIIVLLITRSIYKKQNYKRLFLICKIWLKINILLSLAFFIMMIILLLKNKDIKDYIDIYVQINTKYDILTEIYNNAYTATACGFLFSIVVLVVGLIVIIFKVGYKRRVQPESSSNTESTQQNQTDTDRKYIDPQNAKEIMFTDDGNLDTNQNINNSDKDNEIPVPVENNLDNINE